MRRLLPFAVLLATLLLAGSARAASIWTPLNSGTTSSISALSYSGDDKLFFATSSGQIRQEKADSSGSDQRLNAPGVIFNDIAFSPNGTLGIAVGNGNALYRSTNAGASWTAITGLLTRNDGGATTTATSCSTVGNPIAFNGDLGAVSFKDDTTVYVTPVSGARSAVFKSADAGASFTDVGRTPAGCKIDTAKITDVHAVQGSDAVYFVDQNFGYVWFSSNGLSSPAARKSDSVNCYDQLPRLGIDDADASKIFVSDRCEGTLSYKFSSDAGGTFTRPDFPDGSSQLGARDVATRGGNALFVGKGGGIWQTDGTRAAARPADGALATTQWNAVGMTSPSNAVVGGDGGALVRSTTANASLDISAPGGTISGPSTATAGVPTAFTANVTDDVGGSGIDPASFAWTGNGIAAATGNPVSIVFPAAGVYTVAVSFADKAGNRASATTTVYVSAATPVKPPTSTVIAPGTKNPTASTTSTVSGGGSVTLSGPKTCVAPGKTFSATLAFKRSTKKGAKAIKVTSVVFSIDGKTAKTDKKAPFKQTLSVKSYTAGSKHTLKARAKIKVRKGKAPTKSVSTSFQVCSF